MNTPRVSDCIKCDDRTNELSVGKSYSIQDNMNKQLALLIVAFAVTDAVYINYEDPYSHDKLYNDGLQVAPFVTIPATNIGYSGLYQNHEESYDDYAYPQYAFNYGVNDPHTGDVKSQEEVRDGDVVKGSYSVNEPDGTIRIVEYTADDHNGFNAVVKKIGQSLHPTTIPVAQYANVAPIYYEQKNYDGHY